MAAVSTRPSRAAASPFGSNRRDDGPSNSKFGAASNTRSTTNEQQQTSDKAKKADAEDSSTEGNDDSGHKRASSDPTTQDKKPSASTLSRPPARPGRNGGRSPMNRSSKDDEPNPFEQSFSKPPSSNSTAAPAPSGPSGRFDTHSPRRARSTSPGGSTSLGYSTSAVRTPAGGTKLPSLASLEAASPAGDLANFWDAGQDSLRVGPLSPAMLPGPISGTGDASSRWFNPMQSGLTPLINGMAGTSGGVGQGVGGMAGVGGGGMTPGTAALFQMMTNATPGTSTIKTGGVTKAAEGNAFEDSFGRAAATTVADAPASVKTEANAAPMFMAIQQAPKPLTSLQRTSISGPAISNVANVVNNGVAPRASSLSTQGGLGPRQSMSGPIPVPFGAPQPYPAYGSNAAGGSHSSASPISRHANSISPPYGDPQHSHYAGQGGENNNPLYLLTQAQHHLQHNNDHNDESVMAAAALSKLVGGGGAGAVQQSAGYPAQQEFGHQQQMVMQQQQQAAQQYHAAAAAAAQAQEDQRQSGAAGGRGAKRGSLTGSQTSKDGNAGGGPSSTASGTKRKKSAASQGAAATSASAKKKAKKGKDDDVASSAPKGKAAQHQPWMDGEDDDDDGMDDDDDDDGSGNKKDRKPETDEEKRKNFLERNRQAALKCRQRKKAWLQNLQARVEYLTTDNDALQSQVSTLREEIASLRAVLVAHKDCAVGAHGHGVSAGQTVGGVLAGQTFAPGGKGSQMGQPQMHAPMGAMRGHNQGEDGGRGAAPTGALRY